MDYLHNSTGLVEKCPRDNGAGKRNVQGPRAFTGPDYESIILHWEGAEKSIIPGEAELRCGRVGRHPRRRGLFPDAALYGSLDGWWRDDMTYEKSSKVEPAP